MFSVIAILVECFQEWEELHKGTKLAARAPPVRTRTSTLSLLVFTPAQLSCQAVNKIQLLQKATSLFTTLTHNAAVSLLFFSFHKAISWRLLSIPLPLTASCQHDRDNLDQLWLVTRSSTLKLNFLPPGYISTRLRDRRGRCSTLTQDPLRVQTILPEVPIIHSSTRIGAVYPMLKDPSWSKIARKRTRSQGIKS